ncbi:LOW QUALITY PROTEIN: hypothetical protein JCM24511_02421 [Saitozyma sp. JCM 24511]|nr:LOW QUALITY PROTEIN: hypothetical protein JCM24511_02421 [Saitozyma sp. JCM 24511]
MNCLLTNWIGPELWRVERLKSPSDRRRSRPKVSAGNAAGLREAQNTVGETAKGISRGPPCLRGQWGSSGPRGQSRVGQRAGRRLRGEGEIEWAYVNTTVTRERGGGMAEGPDVDPPDPHAFNM